MNETGKSVAHKHDMNQYGASEWPDGLVPWRDAVAPNIMAGRTTGSLRSCGYCGSMHPADVADAIKAGATGHWADRKYGWPHKAYFDAVPNPHAGLLESRSGCSNPPQAEIDAGKWVSIPTGRFNSGTGKPEFTWTEPGKPAGATANGKFYSVHLQDATAEDRAVIEQHLGLQFDFRPDGKVGWRGWTL
jgi:hypothetical protein